VRRLPLFSLVFAALVPLTSLAGCRSAQSSGDKSAPPAAALSGGGAAGLEPIFDGPLPRPKNVAPMSLTASDGTGLHLTTLKARAVLDEPLAYTEVHLAFANPENRPLEGRFEVTLPPGATVSRFAMKIGDAWQEAEMVEKTRARVAYEDFLHRKQDPALLEQAAPNAFSARVFPIPARGRKEIVIAYAQELAPGAGYAFPLAGLPAVDDLDVTVVRAGDEQVVQERKRRGDEPLTEDVVVAPANLRGGGGVRSGRLVLARVRPVTEAGPEPFEGGTLMLVDTSASRGLGFSDEATLVEGLAREIAASGGPNAHLVVAAFDQDVESIYDGNAAAYDPQATSKLVGRGALGASNLESALTWAAKNAHDVRRVIVVSDGVATAGTDDRVKLTAAAARLRDAGVQRLDAVAVGGIRDEEALAHITSGALANDGVVADGARDAHAIARRLTRTARSGIAVHVEGASWVWPERLDGVQPGDERLVYAEVPEEASVRIRIGEGEPVTPELRDVDKPLLEHTWAQAKIASVLARAEGPLDAKARARVVELSTRYRVLSPYTALLVLETDADYARFKIDRKAPGELLAIRGARVVLEHRGEALLTARDLANKERAKNASTAPMEKKDKGESNEPESSPAATATAAPGDTGADGLAAPKKAFAGPPSGAEPQSFAAGGGGAPSAAAPISPPAMAPPASAPAQAADVSKLQSSEGSSASLGSGRSMAAPPAVRRREGPAMIRSRDERPARDESFIADDRSPYAEPEREAMPKKVNPYTGNFREVMDAIAQSDPKRALDTATRLHQDAPGDVMSLVALGEALEANGDVARAARSYGSLIDLFPARADLRRFAGERLERLRAPGALELAIDTYGKAEEQRPDHPASHRLLAFARLRNGDFAGAFAALTAGIKQRYPEDRFLGVDRILREDLGLVAAAWTRAEPERRDEISKRLREAGGTMESRASIRFVLNWETDSNDVDFHILDAKGGHAFYSHPHLSSGGDLYADVTTGYGPECFTIRAPRGERAGPYKLRAHYYSRGPMGYGMGKLEIRS